MPDGTRNDLITASSAINHSCIPKTSAVTLQHILDPSSIDVCHAPRRLVERTIWGVICPTSMVMKKGYMRKSSSLLWISEIKSRNQIKIRKTVSTMNHISQIPTAESLTYGDKMQCHSRQMRIEALTWVAQESSKRLNKAKGLGNAHTRSRIKTK